MTNRNLCPEIHYRKSEKGLILTACYGMDGQIVLPDEIDGIPITEIGAYAFSDGEEEKDDLVFLSSDASIIKERKRLKTTDVIEIRLPAGIREIGKYAFYRCRNLKKMILSDALLDIGGGALTGCRGIREVEIYFKDGESSALKSILDEVRFAVHATLYMKDAKAMILFPEHYEEAVEDTPARQFFTRHHGAGGDYRQCFYNRELDYKKYDELLPRAIAEDTVETVAGLALGRLRFPYKLTPQAKGRYEKYLREHIAEVTKILVEAEEMADLNYLSKAGFFDVTSLEAGIACAMQNRKTEILSFLMDEKHRLFPKKKKSFEV